MKKTVTQQDLDDNPDLVTADVKVGDEVEIPDEEIKDEEEEDNDDDDDDAADDMEYEQDDSPKGGE